MFYDSYLDDLRHEDLTAPTWFIVEVYICPDKFRNEIALHINSSDDLSNENLNKLIKTYKYKKIKLR